MLRGLIGTVPSEPGNLAYQVYQSDEDRSVFYITERWSTPEDADRHVRFVATNPTIERSAALLLAPPKTIRTLPLNTTPPLRDTGRSPS